MLARALEQVGDRWTLLVVRDLLGTPRRFTDLIALLGGITPKTLSRRLRELQDAGIVEADRQPGRREVWYRLSPAGEDLAPAIEALFLWGLRHASRPPAPAEAVHPEHLLKALRIFFDQAPAPSRPLVWHFAFADDGTYTLSYRDGAWSLANLIDDSTPDVKITTSTDPFTRFLMTPPADRPTTPPGVELTGTAREIDYFRRLLARFPHNIE